MGDNGRLPLAERSSGESGKFDRVLSSEFGVSREMIKKLPASDIPALQAKVKLMQEYLVSRQIQADVLLKNGQTATMLLNQLADLTVLQAEREQRIKNGEVQLFDKEGMLIGVVTDPLQDKAYMENHDRITKLLVDLHKLGIDKGKLDLEKKRFEVETGFAFTVKGEGVVVDGKAASVSEQRSDVPTDEGSPARSKPE